MALGAQGSTEELCFQIPLLVLQDIKQMPAGFHLRQRMFLNRLPETKKRGEQRGVTKKSELLFIHFLTDSTNSSVFLCTGQDAVIFLGVGVAAWVSGRAGRLATCVETMQLLC